MAGPSPSSDRQMLRRQARAARAAFVSALAGPVRRGLEQALARLLAPHLGPPGILGSHAAVGDEIDPAGIEAIAQAAGWTIAFPRVAADGPLDFRLAACSDLKPGYRGIPEPAAQAPAVTPSLFLLPLLAFDDQGNRLGQGGGHYDRTLAALRASGRVIAIGLAWDMQHVPALPPAPWDQPLDGIATPTGFRWFPGRDRGGR